MNSTATGWGSFLARAIRTAWRDTPDPITAEIGHSLQDLAPRLLDAGCGGLGWWAVRSTTWAEDPGAALLRQAFRLHSLQAARHRLAVEEVLECFNRNGLEPVAFKGWTLARLYAHPGLRPFGDIDLLVDTADEPAARRAITELPVQFRGLVDLDMRVLRRFLPDRSFAELLSRARSETVGNSRCLVLAPEDHLRLICLHQLDHGGWRPLWLCDVGAFVERLPPGFRWELCLQGNPRLSDSVVALLSLAEELLGAALPREAPRRTAPNWFRNATLRGWAGGFQRPPEPLQELHRLGWSRALAAVKARWPDPITSTLHLRAPFRGVPRWLLQTAECARRALAFLRRAWNGTSAKPLSSGGAEGQGVLL